MESSVYIIGDKAHKIYKIGKANDVKKRLSTLKVGNPLLELISEEIFIDEPTAFHCEKMLHQKFKSKRYSGEWFSLTDDELCIAMNKCRFFSGNITVSKYRTPSVLSNPIYRN